MEAAKELRAATSGIRAVAEEMKELKALPEKIEKAVKSAEPQVQIDFPKIEETINNAVSKSVKNAEEKVSALEGQMKELSSTLGKLGDSLVSLTTAVSRLESMMRTIEEMKEAVDYNREVLGIIEERLRSSESTPEEEEEEEF